MTFGKSVCALLKLPNLLDLPNLLNLPNVRRRPLVLEIS